MISPARFWLRAASFRVPFRFLTLSLAIAALFVVTALLHAPRVLAQGDLVDPETAPYEVVKDLAGNLSVAGSDTCEAFVTAAAKRFCELQPGVTLKIEAKGSGTAPPALADGSAQLGIMTREMKPAEAAACESKLGQKLVGARIAADALVVYVHRDNPLKVISFVQLEAAFGAAIPAGTKEARLWADLGVGGKLADQPISVIGQPATSGTNGFFREKILNGGEIRAGFTEFATKQAILSALRTNPAGLAFTSFGMESAETRALSLRRGTGPAVEPTGWNVVTGEYPVSRFIFAYPKRGTQPAERIANAFLRFLLSKEGQSAVISGSHLSLPAFVCREESGRLN